MPFEFKLPEISQNQLLMAGLSTLGSSMSGGGNPFAAAMGGFQAGSQMDRANKEDAREQAAYEEQQRQKQAWDAMFNPGGGQQGPQYAQAGGGGDMANVARTPGIAPPIPGQGMPGSIQAMMSNPQAAGLLQSMGPQTGGKFLLEQMFKKPGERKIIKGADGFQYFQDTGERVLPNVEARDPKLLSPEALKQQTQLRKAGKSTTNISNVLGSEKLTPAQEAIDKAYAKDHADFVLGGGYADAQKNLEQMQEVITALEGPGDLTGTITARLPDWARAYVDPEGLNVQQLTEEVVQRNLREVLGAQFTEREGERLIARAYDARLDEKTNLDRLNRLMTAMREGLESRQQASLYLEENGTMRGYEGAKRITIRDLERALDEPRGGGSKADGETAPRMKYNPDTGELEPVS